jgi:hypothetical protein
LALDGFPFATLTQDGAAITWQARLARFQVEPQGQYDNWCWAAVADSVSHCVSASSTFSMCTVASAVLGTVTRQMCNCCDSANEQTCDTDQDLVVALTATGNFDHLDDDNLDADDIAASLNGELPVCLRIAWNETEGHFVGVNGVGTGGDSLTYLSISDPIYGPSSCSTDALRDGGYAVNGGGVAFHGSWSRTFFTKRP